MQLTNLDDFSTRSVDVMLEGFDGSTPARILIQDANLPRSRLAVDAISAATPGLSIGRRSTNDISLKALSVSRSHAKFLKWHGYLVVVDVGSGNGTFVDGRRIKPCFPVSVSPGAEVSFGGAATFLRRK